MKQKKYSESKIKTAQKFLSKYDLSFNALDEYQKQSVVKYTSVQKYLTLCLIVYLFSMIVFITGTYLYYTRAQAGIDKVIELSASGEIINARKYGDFCFDKGVLFGSSSFTALYMLISTIILPLTLRQKQQTLDAFLPALKQSPDDNKISSN